MSLKQFDFLLFAAVINADLDKQQEQQVIDNDLRKRGLSLREQVKVRAKAIAHQVFEVFQARK